MLLFGLDAIRKRITKLERDTCHCCPKCTGAIDSICRRLADVEREISYLRGYQKKSSEGK